MSVTPTGIGSSAVATVDAGSVNPLRPLLEQYMSQGGLYLGSHLGSETDTEKKDHMHYVAHWTRVQKLRAVRGGHYSALDDSV